MTVAAISLATLIREFIQAWQAKQVVTHTFEELNELITGLKGNETASSGVTENLGQTMAYPGKAYGEETGGPDEGGHGGLSGKINDDGEGEEI